MPFQEKSAAVVSHSGFSSEMVLERRLFFHCSGYLFFGMREFGLYNTVLFDIQQFRIFLFCVSVNDVYKSVLFYVFRRIDTYGQSECTTILSFCCISRRLRTLVVYSPSGRAQNPSNACNPGSCDLLPFFVCPPSQMEALDSLRPETLENPERNRGQTIPTK